MLIKQIELNNFRIYKGENTINLLPTDDKNIVVVSGKNGYGKTTFLVSLVWCLYGKRMEKVDALYKKEIEEKGNYAKYIVGCLNRKAKDEDEGRFSVAVTFQGVKIPDIECKEVKIIRSYNTIIGKKDDIKILIDGDENQITAELSKDDQLGEEIFINEFILPIEIAKFFLFDAEKIVALAEMNSPQQRKDLSLAYSEVLGIKKYEDLKYHLESVLDKFRKKAARHEDEKQLVDITAHLEKCEIEIKTLQAQIEELEKEKAEKKAESHEKQIKLIQEGKTMTEEELINLKNEAEALEKKKDALRTDLKEFYDYIPFGLAGEVLLELSEQANQEQNIRNTQYKQEDVNCKINLVINELEQEREKSALIFTKEYATFYHNTIEQLIKKHFFSDFPDVPEKFEVLHELSNVDYNELQNLINKLKHSVKHEFEKISNEYDTTEVGLQNINKKIRDAEEKVEQEHIKILREEKLKLDSRISEIDTSKDILNQKIGELKNKKTDFTRKQNSLRESIDNSIEFSEKQKATKHILNKIKVAIAQYKKKKKKSLEENMLKGLDTLLHKKEFIRKVNVNISSSGEDIDVILLDTRAEKIDKISLSMGERQMYASALLNALVEESDIEFPVFIDSPMQKFDEEHAENIIKYFYPNVSKQVVIFPLINKELTAKEYDILKDKVSKTYLIENLNNDASQFVETEPSQLIEAYQEI